MPYGPVSKTLRQNVSTLVYHVPIRSGITFLYVLCNSIAKTKTVDVAIRILLRFYTFRIAFLYVLCNSIANPDVREHAWSHVRMFAVYICVNMEILPYVRSASKIKSYRFPLAAISCSRPSYDSWLCFRSNFNFFYRVWKIGQLSVLGLGLNWSHMRDLGELTGAFCVNLRRAYFSNFQNYPKMSKHLKL